MLEKMVFPETVEEFMDEYKIIDSDEVYTNGAALVPIFRMNQWFAHKQGSWTQTKQGLMCSSCETLQPNGHRFFLFCPVCGANMEGVKQC